MREFDSLMPNLPEEWEMSFSHDIKTKIASAPAGCEFCPAAELYGILKFSAFLKGGTVNIVTEHAAAAERIERLFWDAMGFVPEKKTTAGGFRFKISEPGECDVVIQKLGLERTDGSLREEIMPFKCCRVSYIRGAFLGGGSITDPNKAYHLEFVTGSKAAADELIDILRAEGISAKEALRKSRSLVYIKGCEDIASLLGLIGAGTAAIEIYNVSIEKEIRNSINRRLNCESANMDKVVKAYGKHMLAIEKIKNTVGFEKLPESLCEIARVRMEYPDESLKELGARLQKPIGKSGVNHRLNRLLEIAEEIPDD